MLEEALESLIVVRVFGETIRDKCLAEMRLPCASASCCGENSDDGYEHVVYTDYSYKARDLRALSSSQNTMTFTALSVSLRKCHPPSESSV